MALELSKIYGLEYGILESETASANPSVVGPAQTRFITPSFNSSPFGLADLNAVDATTSPAVFAGARTSEWGPVCRTTWNPSLIRRMLPIACGCKVLQVDPVS